MRFPLAVVAAAVLAGCTADLAMTKACEADDASVAMDRQSVEGGPLVLESTSSTSSAFTYVGDEPASCPLPAEACATWPSSAEGTITKHTSRETFEGRVLERTFYVFVPARTAGQHLPVVLVLHGGHGSATRTIADSMWPALAGAPPAGLPWRPNTSACRALPVTLDETTLRYTNGESMCEPPVARPSHDRPFIAVFPEGIVDEGKRDQRHWEDGRVPSPGFETSTPNRDDVGFLDHVLDVVVRKRNVATDQTYVIGMSNGGMMTQRLTLEMARHSRLGAVAAFVSFVANLPHPLAPIAPAAIPYGLALFQGTGIPTGTCGVGAATCDGEMVPGDGRCPFGKPGQHFTDVLSGPDTIDAFRGAVGSSPRSRVERVGFFTQREEISFKRGGVLESWVTQGGGHSELSSRQDFHPQLRAWSFLSTFRRAPSGALERQPGASIRGRF